MTSLPYSMKPDPALLARILLPAVVCAASLLPVVVLGHWPAAAAVGFILALCLLAALYRGSRRILLGESGLHFSTLGRPGLQVPYQDIEGLDILAAKTSYLILETEPHGPIRVPIEPFGPWEWAKFVKVIAIQAPHASMSPAVQAMLDG